MFFFATVSVLRNKCSLFIAWTINSHRQSDFSEVSDITNYSKVINTMQIQESTEIGVMLIILWERGRLTDLDGVYLKLTSLAN